MKCSQLKQGDLAQAYRKAARDSDGAEVDMAALSSHLKSTGSSCGACPALLALARKAFEAEGNTSRRPIPDLITPIAERS
jgi:hypothetical protein